jgi:hypothetical protein
MDRVPYPGNGSAALGPVEEVITGEVLSRFYGMPIEVLRLMGRVVVSAHGEVEARPPASETTRDPCVGARAWLATRAGQTIPCSIIREWGKPAWMPP